MMRKYSIILVLALLVSLSLWFFLFTKLSPKPYETIAKKNVKIEKESRAFVTLKTNSSGRTFSPLNFGQLQNETKVSNNTVLDLTSHAYSILNATDRINDNASDGIKVKDSIRMKRHKKVGNYGSCSANFRADALSTPNGTRKYYIYFKYAFKVDENPVKTWITEPAVKQFCGNNIRVYDDKFALLKDIVLDISKRKNANNKPKGGERLKDVLGQSEADEFFEYSKGFWKVRCESNKIPDDVQFPWFQYLEISSDVIYDAKEATNEIDIEKRFTIAVTRGDYVNLHNCVRQMYNAFLLMMIFKKQPKEVAILVLDGHPAGMLDKPWYDIFSHVTRAGTISRPVIYKNLVWGFKESDGGLADLEAEHVPYIEEFRSFFLQEFQVHNSSALDCNTVVITVILRRDKLFHPRNEKGVVGRKIFNEDEIIGDLLKAFPNACVQAILMDALPIGNQLEIIRSTDILIGMHGAGMTHTVFLPQHAAVLEIFPKGFKFGRPWYICYEKIAQWRGLKYASWENFDRGIEMPYDYTILPREQILDKVTGLMKLLCPA